MDTYANTKTYKQASEVILRKKLILTRGGAPFSSVRSKVFDCIIEYINQPAMNLWALHFCSQSAKFELNHSNIFQSTGHKIDGFTASTRELKNEISNFWLQFVHEDPHIPSNLGKLQ